MQDRYRELVTVTNQGATDCVLQGAPSQVVVEASVGSGTYLITGSTPGDAVLLSPQGQASTVLETTTACAGQFVSRAPADERLSLTLDGDTLSIPRGYLPLPSAGCEVSASPVTPYPSALDEPLPTYPGLHARVALPQGAHSDANLDFTVTLTNSGNDPILFGATCPSYVITVGPTAVHSETYQLNCQGTGNRLQAGASIDFAMRVHVPPASAGRLKLLWVLGTVNAGGSSDVT